MMSYSKTPSNGTRPSEALLRSLPKRFQGFPIPEGGDFVPSRASQDELRRLGLPPRPDAKRQPILHRAWMEAFGKPVVLRAFRFNADLAAAAQAQSTFRTIGGPQFSTSRFGMSRNWSGAYIEPTNSRKFLQVYGTWRVPNILNPPPVGNGIDYACSAWIGLDGQRDYFNSSLPQIGTVTTCDSLAISSPASQAWTQWWDRDNHNTLPIPIPDFPVEPGNRVFCIITATTPQSVAFVMVNLSTSPIVATSVFANAPQVILRNNTTAFPSIAGATAEWIIERPRVPHDLVLNNFGPYSATEFDFCVAAEGDSVSSEALLTAEARVLKGAQFIRMYEREHSPERIKLISMPTKRSDHAVSLAFGGF